MVKPRPLEALRSAAIAVAARGFALLRDDQGATLADYALVTAMFAMAFLAMLAAIGYSAGTSPSQADTRLGWLGGAR